MKSMKAPALAGQKGYYLKSSIDDFKKGLRGSHKKDTGGKSMRRMVKLLKSDKQIADIIAYLQSLEPVSAKAKLGGDTGRGEELFSSCVECHGPKGEGVEDQRTPRIAGLADWYTYAQLKHFRDGVRGDSKDPLEKKMIESVTTLSNKDLKNIATYLTTLGK
jgi:cytochrome c553